MSLRLALLAAAAVLAALAGFALQQRLHQAEARAEAVRQLRAHPWRDPLGQAQAFSQWDGKVLVVNFWATWCEPCRTEVPALVRTQARLAGNGVQVVGIGIDAPQKIVQFAKDYQINYPLVAAGLEALELLRALGDPTAALPYTVVIGRSGELAARHLGGLSEQALAGLLDPLI